MKKYLEWIWLPIGLLLGLALGVGYAWVLQPADFRGAQPASLQPVYRGEYILLIATAYQATGDLERAQTRLELFPELNPAVLSSLAQQVVAARGSEDAARGLARLSVALTEQTPMPSYAFTVTSASPSASRATRTENPTLALTVPPLPTATLKPVQISTATAPAGFVLVSREQVCNQMIQKPLVQVLVRTPGGKGVAGVTIRILWEGGGSAFVTGMKPELSPGYADYEIEPGKVYQIALGDGLTVVRDVSVPTCPGATAVAGGGTNVAFDGSWRLVFEMR
ncbi:MAG: hypothetical protein JW748_09885 [Anaerolineales bacterium]|nr:hypothetical protein [Anaerolineales bacterium]